MRRRPPILLLVLCPFIGAALFHSSPRSHEPLRQSIYIWQRAWTPAVRESAATIAPSTSGLFPLSAEVSWEGARPTAARTHPDFSGIPTATPVGLALRIGPYSGSFSESDEPANFLKQLASSLIAEARATGREPSELHLDFDCPTSKLRGYQTWVRAISAAVAPTPVAITALPTWLSSPDFPPLAQAAGSFILQVHSLDRPRLSDPNPSLCDTNHARRWVEKAARLKIPFRVALPTYGYLAATNEHNKLLGIVAENDPPEPIAGATFREVRADPDALAHLIHTWQSDHPASLTGIIWYRLPVKGDRLNWSWPTLASVMRGKAPSPHLTLQARESEPGLYELIATNTGTADAILPGTVTARWTVGTCLASDGLAEFEPAPPAARSIQFTTRSTIRLAPDQQVQLAWLRLDHSSEIHIDAPSLD